MRRGRSYTKSRPRCRSAAETLESEAHAMAKKLTRPVPVTAPDLLQQLRGRIELARRNDGTWDAMDGGKMTPMKLAVAMVLWTQHKCLENAGIDSLLAGKRAIGDDLWAAVDKIRYEIMIADIEELIREKEDEKEHGETRSAYGRAWVRGHLPCLSQALRYRQSCPLAGFSRQPPTGQHRSPFLL